MTTINLVMKYKLIVLLIQGQQKCGPEEPFHVTLSYRLHQAIPNSDLNGPTTDIISNTCLFSSLFKLNKNVPQKSPLILSFRHCNILVHIKSKMTNWLTFRTEKKVHLIIETSTVCIWMACENSMHLSHITVSVVSFERHPKGVTVSVQDRNNFQSALTLAPDFPW